MTDAELAAIEARCRAATPGPWMFAPLVNVDSPSGEVVGIDWTTCDTADLLLRDADGAFIAHARTDVPDLCAEVRRLTAENARLREGMMEALTEGARLTGEVARLSSALDAAARVVARKADRAAGREET